MSTFLILSRKRVFKSLFIPLIPFLVLFIQKREGKTCNTPTPASAGCHVRNQPPQFRYCTPSWRTGFEGRQSFHCRTLPTERRSEPLSSSEKSFPRHTISLRQRELNEISFSTRTETTADSNCMRGNSVSTTCLSFRGSIQIEGYMLRG